MTGRTRDISEEGSKEKMEGCPVGTTYGAGGTPLTYNKYLKVEELKSLQICQSEPAHHDEPLFIIIHQTYELWFKLILHELDLVVEMLKGDRPKRAIFYLRRVVAIMKVLVNQIHILETMEPREFLGFRHNLNPASGFQSSQFREVEFMAGLRNEHMLKHFEDDPVVFEKLTERFNSASLGDLFYDLLEKKGFELPRAKKDDSEDELAAKELKRINELKRIYEDPDKYYELHELAEVLIDVDELIGLWRTHHVTVVERIIGFKRGTGGSEGVGYLRSTLTKRCFPDLWHLRTHLEL